MQVTVLVRKDVAPALHQPQPVTPAAQHVRQTIEGLGVTLEPLHPGTRDPTLGAYFVVQVPDATTAERVIARLQQSEAVESVYLKPPEALP